MSFGADTPGGSVSGIGTAGSGGVGGLGGGDGADNSNQPYNNTIGKLVGNVVGTSFGVPGLGEFLNSFGPMSPEEQARATEVFNSMQTNQNGFDVGGTGTTNAFGVNPMNTGSIFQQAAGLQSNAITEAAGVETDYLQQALQQIQGLLGSQGGANNPQDLDQMLTQIMGGDQFSSLVDERQRGIQGQLSAGGLTRSGAAITEGARVPTDLAFEIENMLAGRQQQQQQFTGDVTSQIAQLLGLTGMTQGNAIRGSAEAEASGLLGEKQFDFAQSQANQQSSDNTTAAIINGLATAFSS